MRYYCINILLCCVCLLGSCQKKEIANKETAIYFTSIYNDTLKMDTTVANAVSTTKSFKIFNYNQGYLEVDTLCILGASSPYYMTLSGLQQSVFTRFWIAPKDSTHVFVNMRAPKIVEPFETILDSIVLKVGSKERKYFLQTVVKKN